MAVGIQTKPEPTCPDCGTKMVLREPKRWQNHPWPPFWGCPRYPSCDGTREIGEDGKAVVDEIER